MRKELQILFLIILMPGGAFGQSAYLDLINSSVKDSVKANLAVEASSYFKFKRLDSTLYFGNRAIELSRKANLPAFEASALLQMSLSYGSFGNESKALTICIQAIKIGKENKFLDVEAWSLLQLGKLYTASREYSKAIIAFKESISILRSLKNEGEGLPQTRMAEAFMLMNELDSALYYCNDCDQDQHRLGRYILGKIQHKMGNNDIALNYLHQSLNIVGDNSYTFETYYSMAQVFLDVSQIDSAIFYGNKALAEARKTGFYSQIVDGNTLLSEIFEKRNLPKALYFSRRAKAYSDSLYSMGRQTAFDNLFDFDEQQRQYELEAAKSNYNNQVQRLWLFSISGALLSLTILALVLYRNSLNRKKANEILKQQKEEVLTTLEKLQSTQSQLIQSEKMASLGELTAGIAHEIQNPLNFVNNFSEVNRELIEELKDAVTSNDLEEIQLILKDLAENEEKVKHHGKRADGIVKSMLEHSRSSDGKKELTDINALADEYLRLAYHGMRAKDKSFNSEFKTEFDETLPKVDVIPQDIGRVLLNLLNNAFYAVDKKVKEGVDERYKPEVVVTTKKHEKSIEISVADNGGGIPEQVRDKIFQPFFTTKPTGSGTGLGLSLSYDIIKAHGGEIRAENNKNEGSKFIILLAI